MGYKLRAAWSVCMFIFHVSRAIAVTAADTQGGVTDDVSKLSLGTAGASSRNLSNLQGGRERKGTVDGLSV